jgi:type IV pilus assembly protein PilC
MPTYQWEGKNLTGRIVHGEATADSVEILVQQLRQRRIEPVLNRIKVKGRGIALTIFEPRAKTQDLIVFSRQFATMIGAGIPIVQSLEILTVQSENKAMKKVVNQVSEDVKMGSTLADAFKKHPKVFDDLYVHMVAAGEVGGILDSILGRLSVYLEKANKLKRKIKGAMVYPVSIVAVAVVVTAVLLIYVIPVFADLFSSFGQALPGPTQFVINLSNFTVRNIHWMVIGMVALGIGFRLFCRTVRGRTLVDRLYLKVPIFGDLVCKAAVARFSRTLGTLISSGVSIIDALMVTAKTAGNKIVENTLLETRSRVMEGLTIAEPIFESRIFPPMVGSMVQVGETTGALDHMLGKIADFYEEEVDNAVANLTALMEPIVMVVLGVIMGGLIISMYLPIFRMGAVVG